MSQSRDLLEDVMVEVLKHVSDDGEVHVRPDHWNVLVELGWPLAGLDPGFGGAGGSLYDVVALVEGVASMAARFPLIETHVARWAAEASAAAWQPDAIGTYALDDSAIRRQKLAGVWVGTGELRGVPWASVADLLVVPAGGELVVVQLDDTSIDIVRGTNIADEPRCTVRLHETLLAPAATGLNAEGLRDRAALLRAAALIGAGRGAHRLSVAHARIREQFGRPVGTFQLVAAALAEMASELALAEGALEAAVEAHIDGQHTTSKTAAALLTANAAATIIARVSHQVHGAIGVTREHSLHRFTRRLWSWRDDVEPEYVWKERLGAETLRLGVEGFWSVLTSADSG